MTFIRKWFVIYSTLKRKEKEGAYGIWIITYFACALRRLFPFKNFEKKKNTSLIFLYIRRKLPFSFPLLFSLALPLILKRAFYFIQLSFYFWREKKLFSMWEWDKRRRAVVVYLKSNEKRGFLYFLKGSSEDE